jgi:hypothetical protein
VKESEIVNVSQNTRRKMRFLAGKESFPRFIGRFPR